MTDLRVVTNGGAEAVLSEGAIEEFRAKLRGEILDLFVKTPRQPGARWG